MGGRQGVSGRVIYSTGYEIAVTRLASEFGPHWYVVSGLTAAGEQQRKPSTGSVLRPLLCLSARGFIRREAARGAQVSLADLDVAGPRSVVSAQLPLGDALELGPLEVIGFAHCSG